MLTQGFLADLHYRKQKRWAGLKNENGLDVEALRRHILSVRSAQLDPPPVWKRFGHKLVGQLTRHATALDQLMQSQPEIASAAWGIARFILNVRTSSQSIRV